MVLFVESREIDENLRDDYKLASGRSASGDEFSHRVSDTHTSRIAIGPSSLPELRRTPMKPRSVSKLALPP